MIFIARRINYPPAMKDALKLKKVSYIHEEISSGSEPKHGPVALLDSQVPVVALAYYRAEYLGKDVDQPRNLAKSVTVE